MGGRGAARRLLAVGSSDPEDYIKARVGTGAWWHDTSDMFKDDAGTMLATANLDPVGKWNDLGPNGHHHYQGSLAAKPRINTNVLNGKRGVSFDGGDWLETIGNMSISTFAVWCVFSASSTSTRLVYEHSTNANISDGMYLNTSTLQSIRVRRASAASDKNLTANWGAGNVWRVVRHESDGTHTGHRLAIDGAVQSMANGDGTANVGAGTATQRFFVGARSGPLFAITGVYTSLLVVSPYPDAAFIAYVDNYFANRYNIPLAA